VNRPLCPALLALALALAPLPGAASFPSCVPEGSVLENPGFDNDVWLSKDGGDTVRMHLSKAMDSQDWRGNELYRSCAQQQTPCSVAEVDEGPGAGEGPAGAAARLRQLRKTYQVLARESGHTPQEGDVLATRYAALGSYFRQVRKEGGGWESEGTAIERKHRKQLGMPDDDSGALPGQAVGSQKARVADLQARMAAAKQRGDKAELMRLLGEAQQLASGMEPQASQAKFQKATMQQAWLLAESSYTELLTASYRSRISLGKMCICAGACRRSVGEGADKER